jgi:hypothetical protein
MRLLVTRAPVMGIGLAGRALARSACRLVNWVDRRCGNHEDGRPGSPTVSGIGAAQARVYLSAFALWTAGWVIAFVQYGGRETVVGPAAGLQLASMFLACAVICGVAWALTAEAEGASMSFDLRTPNDFLRFGVSWTLRCWFLLLGGAVPAAVRALVSSRAAD